MSNRLKKVVKKYSITQKMILKFFIKICPALYDLFHSQPERKSGYDFNSYPDLYTLAFWSDLLFINGWRKFYIG